MHNIKSRFISLSLLAILFHGCGNSEIDSSQTYLIAIGESASLVSNESNATMAPSEEALKLVVTEIGKVIQTHINEMNEKEAITFIKETNYCEISGVKNVENSGTLTNIVSTMNYNNCNNDTTIQNGTIEINYRQNDDDGKFAQSLQLTIKENYTFNKIILKENLVVSSDTVGYYPDGSVKSFDIKITGVVDYNYQTLSFQNREKTFSF